MLDLLVAAMVKEVMTVAKDEEIVKITTVETVLNHER